MSQWLCDLWVYAATDGFVSSAQAGHLSRLLVLLWLGWVGVSRRLYWHLHMEAGMGSGLIPYLPRLVQVCDTVVPITDFNRCALVAL